MDGVPITEESAFHPDNFNIVTIIQLARIYDLLAVIARGINEVDAETVLNAHEAGAIVGPPLSFIPGTMDMEEEFDDGSIGFQSDAQGAE